MQREPRRKTALCAGDSHQHPFLLLALQKNATSNPSCSPGVRWVQGRTAAAQEVARFSPPLHSVESPRRLRLHQRRAQPHKPQGSLAQASPETPENARSARPHLVTHRKGPPLNSRNPWAALPGGLGARQRPDSARQLPQPAGATPTGFWRCGAHSVVRQCRAAGTLRSRAFGVAAHLVWFLGGPREAWWAEQPPLGPG